MKFLGETSLKKLISLIKGEIATKQNKITTNGILQCDGDGNISAASLDKNSVGLGNVGNFKAVSTAASQGLTTTEKTNARTNIGAGTGTYSKPLTGIPKTDFASAVQASLDKADTALQSHQDISGKVDKVTGKGLSTNDFTTDEKNKLAGIATGANKTTVDSALSDSSTNPVQNKIVKSALDGKAASSHSHDYLPLSGGTLTGNLTGKYLTGTWLQTTATSDLGKTPPNVAVLDDGGWVYKRTPAELLSDMLGKTTITLNVTSDAYLKNYNCTAFVFTGLKMGFVRIYGQTNVALTNGTSYRLTDISANGPTNYMHALSINCSKKVTAWIGGNGVYIRPLEAIGVGYDVIITGWWVY